jgi:membrane protease YdiL (CAAX protease family)
MTDYSTLKTKQGDLDNLAEIGGISEQGDLDTLSEIGGISEQGDLDTLAEIGGISERDDLDTLAEIVASGALSSGEISETEVINRLTINARSWRQGLRFEKPAEKTAAPLPSVCPFDSKNFKANILTFLLIAFAGVCFCVFVTFGGELSKLRRILPASLSVNNTSHLFQNPLLYYLTAVVSPFLSELFFRKFLFGFIRKHTRFAFASLISAFINAALSAFFFDNFRGMAVQFIYAFCAAFFCAFVFEHTKNIWAPIIFHFFTNTAGMVIAGFFAPPIDPNIATIIMAVSGVAAIYTFAALTLRMEHVGEKPF